MSKHNIFRQVYDAVTDSKSKFGRIGKNLYPFNGQYFVRDAWRKYVKPYFHPQANSAAVVNAGGLYGPTGSIVGRY